MSRATSPETGRRYGIQRVCGAWQLPRSTWYAQTAAMRPDWPVPLKRGPKTVVSDAELADAIRGVLATSPFVGEGHRKVWAKLRHAGTRCGKPRVLRVMRASTVCWRPSAAVATADLGRTMAPSPRRRRT